MGGREREKEKKEGKYLNKYLLVFCPAPGIGHPSHIASLPCICKVLSEGYVHMKLVERISIVVSEVDFKVWIDSV